MPLDVPDRSQNNRDAKMAKDMVTGMSGNMKAKCGHEDMLGYFSGTVCGKCARKNHRKAMGGK